MRSTARVVPVILAAMMLVGCGQRPMVSAPALQTVTPPAASVQKAFVTRGPKAAQAQAKPGQVRAQGQTFSTYVEFEAGRLSFGKSEVANFLDGYGSYFDSFEFLKVKGGLLSATYRVYIYGRNAQHVDYVADALWSWIDRQSHRNW